MDLDAIFRLMDRAEKSCVYQGGSTSRATCGCLWSAASCAPLRRRSRWHPRAEAAREQEEKDAVRSPISGVFYLAKEPGAEPFVQAGSSVNKGDTLCIIEAMKTMNEIRAPRSGVITGILRRTARRSPRAIALFLLSEGN